MSNKSVVVPALGESVTEATVSQWMKKAGDAVKADEPIVALETDKITLEVNAPASGVLSEIIVQEGASVEVGAILAKITEGAVSAVKANENKASSQAPAPAPAPVVAKPAPTPAPAASSAAAVQSPAVRKIVAETGVDVSAAAGSGKDGRLTKGDVISMLAAQTPAVSVGAPNHVATGTVAKTGPREERVRMTKLRQTIARRLKEAQNTAAMLTTFNEIDMSAVMALRNKYKDNFEKKYQVKLGFMSFFVKAAVQALQELPAVNAQIDGDDIIYKNYYDIGVAVGTDQGLVVPVIRGAENMNFADIEKTIADLGKRARDGKLTMAELSGGTFTITNGGTYGSLMSTPIINPPQSGILGMHKIQERAVVVNGQVVARPMMFVALSYDHRIIDGKEAVTFLVRIKEAVEDPERLMLGV